VQETRSDAQEASRWGGGVSPFAVNRKKVGMWLFLVSDSVTFSALLLAYGYVRLANPAWPRPFEVYPAIAMSAGMTVILLASGLTMVLGVAAAHREERGKAVRWLLLTALGGIVFIGLHLSEWVSLIHEGYTPWSTPQGVPLFGAAFFGITGMHMLHVAAGVVYLLIMAAGFGKKRFTADDVEVSGLYWHFVDLVWMFVFPMVYLMSIKP
jgi:cytochrome c oxidase subunit III